MPITDHREVDRHVTPGHLAPVLEGATNGATVHPPDLTARSMFINASQFLSTGSPLKLRLLLSKVRHRVPGQGVGMEFVNPSPEVPKAIDLSAIACKSKQNSFLRRMIPGFARIPGNLALPNFGREFIMFRDELLLGRNFRFLKKALHRGRGASSTEDAGARTQAYPFMCPYLAPPNFGLFWRMSMIRQRSRKKI